MNRLDRYLSFLLILVLGIMFFISYHFFQALDYYTNNFKTIEVNESIEKNILLDSIKFKINITIEEKTIEELEIKSEEKISRLKNILSEFNIKKEDIITTSSNMSVISGKNDVIEGYKISNNIDIVSKNKDKTPEIIKAVALEKIEIKEQELFLYNQEKYIDEIRSELLSKINITANQISHSIKNEIKDTKNINYDFNNLKINKEKDYLNIKMSIKAIYQLKK